MVYQFAWTLRAGRARHRLQHHHRRPAGDHGGRQRRSSASTSARSTTPYDVQASSLLFAVRDGPARVRGLDCTSAPVDGPLGQTQYGDRAGVASSLTADLAAVGHRAAARRSSLGSVNDDRRTRSRRCSAGPPTCSAGVGLRRPAVDRRPDGRRRPGQRDRHGRDEDRAIPVDVPGITGQRVRDFLVSRDGTRLVAVVQGQQADTLRISRIRYDALGRVAGATRSRNLPWSAEDAQRIRDIGWRSATSVGVLHQLTRRRPPRSPRSPSTGRRTQTQTASACRTAARPSSPRPCRERDPVHPSRRDGLVDPTGAEA